MHTLYIYICNINNIYTQNRDNCPIKEVQYRMFNIHWSTWRSQVQKTWIETSSCQVRRKCGFADFSKSFLGSRLELQ